MTDQVSVHSVTGVWLGITHTHKVPRIGEVLQFNDQTWRVIDVAHPSENQRGVGIHPPRVQVKPEDVRWLDDHN